MPDDIEAAFTQGVKFLNGGQIGEEKEEVPIRLFSFEKDANLIFAAFKQTHGIDLSNTENLHWWKFIALFMDLGSETTFCQLIGLRKRVKTGKATKEEKEAAREMGDMFEIPEPEEPLTAEEQQREREFMRALGLG